MEADPVLIDVWHAREKIPLKEHSLLHAGPPITWRDASGPLKGAIIGAIMLEGWANSAKKAETLVAEGVVTLDCTHHHNCVGPMAGVISPGMPIFELEDKKFGTKTYSNFNEGTGKVLRYGAYDKSVLERLRWIDTVLFPAVKAGLKSIRDQEGEGGIPIKPIIAKALVMGDDCHNRCAAATSLFTRNMMEGMLASGIDKAQLLDTLRFFNRNDFTALNLAMAAAKAMTLAAHDIKYSTIVSVMSRNGTNAGIWVSGLKSKWFAARAPVPNGLLFPGYTQTDANPDIGDSSITETAGFGGFAMAAAPAIVSWVGGSAESAIEVTRKMYAITSASHKYFLIPFLNFRGTPIGIDIRKVLKTGILPTINTGIAHKLAGVGQIGAGTISFPFNLFREGFKDFVDEYGV